MGEWWAARCGVMPLIARAPITGRAPGVAAARGRGQRRLQVLQLRLYKSHPLW